MALQPVDENGKSVPCLKIGTTEIIDGTSASAQSTTTFTANTVIRVVSDSAVNLAVGANPTATSSTLLLPANTVEYFRISAGQEIAVLGGSLNLTVME